ncbi:response regulator transcription factor [Marinomonas ostreistagni]|uniref:Response regulator transcription factor n=1 Tax=Marinomonas ostreistagni TaxID=359209 RepID=A0ABS0Z881_9GAMM|nr:response regulator transcription factor [Marinomonas ostreistagni]MBJ7549663.1 response regulator transcription factor [Marinomonas ostreistagni]
MRILVIEDDSVLCEAVSHRIKSIGHGVDLAQTGKQASLMLRQQCYDLILLDLNLPDAKGETLLQSLRQQKSATPVLVVTARGQVEERIKLLDLGADDYITKPFDFGELEARIRAILRRSQGQAQETIEFSDVCLNLRTCSVTVGEQAVELKQREFRLLEIFMSQPKQVLSKEVLMDHIYGFDEAPGPNVIEIYVARLRKTLAHSALHIRTIRGLGYLLEEHSGISQ